jgi:hypothetical protein
MALRECKFLTIITLLTKLFADLSRRMVLLAAYSLIIAHPGFAFKNGERLVKDDSVVDEPKHLSDESSGEEGNARYFGGRV